MLLLLTIDGKYYLKYFLEYLSTNNIDCGMTLSEIDPVPLHCPGQHSHSGIISAMLCLGLPNRQHKVTTEFR